MFYIEEVKFNNFRQYRKPERSSVNFVFDKENKKNVNIIEGTSGFGKTNFLSGLQWCFYGDEGKKIGEEFILLNRLTADGLLGGDQAEVSVEIVINYDGDRYSVKRSKNFKKSDNEIIAIPTGDSKGGTQFEIFALDQDNSKIEETPESTMKVLVHIHAS
jgi:DNA repair exonuclease SbcCD ATPase subunit